MATIDTGSQIRALPQVESRPVAPNSEPRPEPQQAVAQIQEIAAQSTSSRNKAVTEMDKVQARLQDAIATLNERMKSSQKDLSFSVDQISKRFVVTVMDQNTGEVIRSIPGESVLRVAHNIEALKGVLFEETL
jgi:flagellar protein FlaG